MVRLMGAVFDVAATGALFKALENDKLAGLLTAAGANLDGAMLLCMVVSAVGVLASFLVAGRAPRRKQTS
jgi:hypothetical protein